VQKLKSTSTIQLTLYNLFTKVPIFNNNSSVCVVVYHIGYVNMYQEFVSKIDFYNAKIASPFWFIPDTPMGMSSEDFAPFQTCLATMPHYCVTFVPGILDVCGLLSGGLLSTGLVFWIWIFITQYATPQPAHLRCRIRYTPSLIVFTFNLAVVSIVTSSVFITKRGIASSVSLR